MDNLRLEFYLVSFEASLSEEELFDIADQVPESDDSPVVALSVINTTGQNRVLSIKSVNVETLRECLDGITSQPYDVCYDSIGDIGCSVNAASEAEAALDNNPLVF